MSEPVLSGVRLVKLEKLSGTEVQATLDYQGDIRSTLIWADTTGIRGLHWDAMKLGYPRPFHPTYLDMKALMHAADECLAGKRPRLPIVLA